MDIIYLHGLRCQCVIGVWQWERKIAQTLVLDLDLATDNKRAAENDNLEDAINYQRVGQRVIEYAEASSFDLIETLVERLAELILEEFEVDWVRIKLDKGAAVKGVKNVGVQIERGEKPA